MGGGGVVSCSVEGGDPSVAADAESACVLPRGWIRENRIQ